MYNQQGPPPGYPPQGYPPPPGYPQGYPPLGYPPPGYGAQPLKTGMALASLIIGLISFFVCGGLCVGPILGLIFGIIALKRANNEPMVYGGKGLAIGGIVASVASVASFGIFAAIAVPNLLKSRQAANEASAIFTVRTIGIAQATYQTKHGKFADLSTLAAEGLISNDVASGVKSGYQFTSTPVNTDDPDLPPMFDTTAVPITSGATGTGNRSFGSNETYVIYKADGAVELKGTPDNRVPVGGTAISRNRGGSGALAVDRVGICSPAAGTALSRPLALASSFLFSD